jgi:hypothetical protein
LLVQEHILHDVPALGVAALERDVARGRDRAGGVTRGARGDQTKHLVPMLGGFERASLNARRRVAGGGRAGYTDCTEAVGDAGLTRKKSLDILHQPNSHTFPSKHFTGGPRWV